MSRIALLISFTWSTVVSGQNLSKAYFDREGNGCSPESSYCYRVCNKSRDTYSYDTVKFYYTKNNRLQAIGLRDQFGNRLGLHESFYENGNLKSRIRYDVDRSKKREDFPPLHPGEARPDDPVGRGPGVKSSNDSIRCIILEFNDSLGHPMVQNGEGMVDGRLDFMVERGKVVNGLRDSVWTAFYDHEKVYCYESWHLGQLIDGISYDPAGKEYYYQEVLVLPGPVGGFQEFYRQTSRRISYPRDAQRRSVEGKVLVEVMVEQDGRITAPGIAKGLGFGCDEEALKAVSISPPWLPAKRRGQPINHKMIIPIAFKLK